MNASTFITPVRERSRRTPDRTSQQREWSSDVFVIARDSRQPIQPPLKDSPSVTLTDSDAFPASIDVFGNVSRVKRLCDETTHLAIYLVGHAATSEPLDESELLRWCATTATGSSPKLLRDLHGVFVLIIDNRATREVTFVSDCLGLRQWFIGRFEDRLVAGSNVRQLLAAGLSRGRVNYDAVASWLRFNHPCASLSVLEDYQGIEPAIVRVYRPDGSCIRSAEWGRPEFGLKVAALDEVVDESFHAAADAQRALTRGIPELHLPISGGYDSRLLLALASRDQNVPLRVVSVETRDEDVAVAQEVSRTLGHACEILRAGNHVIDLFDDPFAFTPGGFLTGRNLTSAIARHRRGVPILNGFIGDDLVRGSIPAWRNQFYLMDAEAHSLDELAMITERRFAYEHHWMHLFRDAVRRRANQRAREELLKVLRRGQESGRTTTHATMYCHERLYFANIILQHLDVAEGIAPLCSFCDVELSLPASTGLLRRA